MAKDESQISRQARWQRKHRAMGLCVLCSKPAFKGWRCRKHYEQHKITMRLRYIPKVRGRYNVGGIAQTPPKARTATRTRLAAAAGAADGTTASRADGSRRAKAVPAKPRSGVATAGARITGGAASSAPNGAAASSGAAKAAARRKRVLPGKAKTAGTARPRRSTNGSAGTGADRRNGS